MNYFTINPFTTKGLELISGQYGVLTTAGTTLPNNATVGSSGSLGRLTVYGDSNKSSILFYQDGAWTLEADTVNTAYVCNNSTTKALNESVIGVASVCLKIQPNGTVLGIKAAFNIDGTTITFR